MRTKLNDHITEVAGRLYRQNLSLARIAPIIGVSAMTVRKAVLRSGTTLRPRINQGGACVECGKPSGPNKRCAYHKKIALADQKRDWARENLGCVPRYDF